MDKFAPTITADGKIHFKNFNKEEVQPTSQISVPAQLKPGPEKITNDEPVIKGNKKLGDSEEVRLSDIAVVGTIGAGA